MSSCSPAVKDKRLTCYSKNALVTIAKEYNTAYPKNQIPISGMTKRDLWYKLRNSLGNTCTQEWCWLDQDFINRLNAKKIAKETFRPKMPEEWKKK